MVLKRGATWENNFTGKINQALNRHLIPPPKPKRRPEPAPFNLEVNFLGVYKWHYGEKKIILTEIYKITEARYNAEDPDYEKVLKHYLPAAYREFKDVFF